MCHSSHWHNIGKCGLISNLQLESPITFQQDIGIRNNFLSFAGVSIAYICVVSHLSVEAGGHVPTLAKHCLFDRTLEERAQRLFLTKGKKLEELDRAFFTKSKPGKTAGKTRYICRAVTVPLFPVRFVSVFG